MMKRSVVIRRLSRFGSFLFVAGAGAWLGLATLPTFAAADPLSCSASPERQQFDYWLGDWTITYPGAPGGSTSKVYLTLDKCVLVESWDGGKGHKGENVFAYSSDDGSWHGMFADNQGRVHVFEGKVTPGSAEFYGPSRSSSGATVLNRIRVVRVNADKVTQTWEKSADNGGTWTTEFQGEYSRKKP